MSKKLGKKLQQLIALVLIAAMLWQTDSMRFFSTAYAAEMESIVTEETDVTLQEETLTEEKQVPVTVLGEVEELRTEDEKHFRMSDGSYRAAQYDVPVHFMQNGEWTDYAFEMKGTEGTACVLAITSEEKGKWFIDDLKATVSLNAAEILPLPVRTYESKELSCDVNDFSVAGNDKIAYTVTASWAVRQQENVVMQIPEVKSEKSNIVMVDFTTGVNSVGVATQAKVAVRNQSLAVTNPQLAGVAIYTADGRQVVRTASAPASAIFTVAQPGYYIVVVGQESFKVYVGK